MLSREPFPIFKHHPEFVYLDTAATAHKPKCVIEALSQFYSTEYATVHRAAYSASLIATQKYHEARQTVQKFIHAKEAEEIVFTRGATDAINLVARTFPFSEGDEIVISEMEHHSNIVPWQMAAQRAKAKIRWIPVLSDGTLDWKNFLTPKTKLVAIGHVSNVTGTINPIREIAKEAHRFRAKILIDGAQAAPSMPVDVQDLGADFYVFSGHKCYGPTGIGILYGKKEVLETLPPLDGGGDMILEVGKETTTYQAPPLRFEAGTPIIGSAIALKTALDFIEGIGREEIFAHGQELLRYAEEKLILIPRLKIIGTAPEKGPILTFSIDGAHPLDIASFLDVKGIAIRSGHLCAQPLLKSFGLTSACRASFGIYNSKQDVDQFVTAMRQLTQILK
jgi:cysteine desulfurase/selenocysteine lyase